MGDCGSFREWLDLELDGALSALERRELDRHLAGCEVCRRERQDLARLRRRLEGARMPVREGFRARVMASLPGAGWEARAPRAWRLPGLLLALLGGSTLALAAGGALRLEPQAPMLAALLAVVELLATSALAGAQMMGASWRALGFAVNELVLTSPTGVAALVLVVVCLNLLLVRLLLGERQRPSPQNARSRAGDA